MYCQADAYVWTSMQTPACAALPVTALLSV